MEPKIRIIWSESDHPQLQAGLSMSLGVANRLFRERDALCVSQNETELVGYEVICSVSDRERHYNIFQRLGDGTGSAIARIRVVAQLSLKQAESLAWLMLSKHIVKGKGRETDLLDVARCFCNVALPALEDYSERFEKHAE